MKWDWTLEVGKAFRTTYNKCCVGFYIIKKKTTRSEKVQQTVKEIDSHSFLNDFSFIYLSFELDDLIYIKQCEQILFSKSFLIKCSSFSSSVFGFVANISLSFYALSLFLSIFYCCFCCLNAFLFALFSSLFVLIWFRRLINSYLLIIDHCYYWKSIAISIY